MSKKLQYMILGAGLTLFVMVSALTLLLRSASAETTLLPNVDKPIQSEQHRGNSVIDGNEDVNQETGDNSFATLPEQAVSAELSDYVTTSESNLPSLPGTVDEPETNMEVIVQAVSELVQKNQEHVWGEGRWRRSWLHVSWQEWRANQQEDAVYHLDADRTMPLDALIPESPVSEKWYAVDQNFNFSKAVSLLTSADGTVHQKSVFVDNTWINLTLLEAGTVPEHYTSSKATEDSAFPSAKYLRILNEMLTWQNVTMEAYQDASQYIVIAEKRYDEPLTNAAFTDEPVVGSQMTLSFDVDTGQLLSLESYTLFQNDEYALNARREFLVVELLPKLPNDIVQLLGSDMETLFAEETSQ